MRIQTRGSNLFLANSAKLSKTYRILYSMFFFFTVPFFLTLFLLNDFVHFWALVCPKCGIFWVISVSCDLFWTEAVGGPQTLPKHQLGVRFTGKYRTRVWIRSSCKHVSGDSYRSIDEEDLYVWF